MFLPAPGLYVCLFIPRCSGHTITQSSGFPEIQLEEIWNILPCNSHRGQEFYYSGQGIAELLLGALHLL